MRSFFSKYLNIKNIKSNAIAKNFLYLGTVQSLYLLVPLLLTPYLVKTLGMDNYGKIILSQSIVNALNTLIDYGFGLSATRSISINRGDTREVNNIFSSTMLAKLILLAAGFIILNLLLLVPIFAENRDFFLFSFVICIGQALVPAWVYQGIEKLSIYSTINVAFKMLYILSVFIFVTKSTDYTLANLLLGASNLLCGICCIVFLYTKYGFHFVRVTVDQLKHTFKDGFYYFVSSFFVNIYSYSSSIILRFFTNDATVGLYGIIEKIMQLAKQVIIIYLQVVHPAACLLVSKSYAEYKKFIKKAYIPFLLFYTVFCAAMFIFAYRLPVFFNTPNVVEATALIRIVVFALLINCLSIPAYLSLLALHFPKSYSFVLISSSVISIIINTFLVYLFGLKGSIYNILITEFLITTGMHYMLQFRHKQYALFAL